MRAAAATANPPRAARDDECLFSKGALYRGKRMRGVTYALRCLSESAQKTTAHSLPIAEPGVASNFFNWQTTLLQQQSRGFESKIFDRLGRRLASFRAEYPAELARAKSCSFRKLLHRQGFSQVLSGESKRILDAVRFRIELKHGRMLGLASSAPMMDDHHPSSRSGDICAHVAFD
jgi:hypothetical protein